jgi:hypothetical protein
MREATGIAGKLLPVCSMLSAIGVRSPAVKPMCVVMSKVPGDNWFGFLFVGDDPALFLAYEIATAQALPADDSDKVESRQWCWKLILAGICAIIPSTTACDGLRCA